MQTSTVLLIILAALLSLIVVYFQYYFRGKQKGMVLLVLSLLRFIGIFGVLLLLINPKFSKINYTLEKPNLAVLIDNSTSIKTVEQKVQEIQASFDEKEELANRFDMAFYSFGQSLRPLDSLTFSDLQTNIQKPVAALKEVYARRNTAVVLISDGNQNIGKDYVYAKELNSPPIFTITVGDTTKYEDLSIGPINNNKYPLETYVSYQGGKTVDAKVQVKVNGVSVYKENIELSKNNNFQNINTLITANTVGIKTITVTVKPLGTERNTTNNMRETAVEVINEKTTVALVSDMLHPDLGTIKKSIESN